MVVEQKENLSPKAQAFVSHTHTYTNQPPPQAPANHQAKQHKYKADIGHKPYLEPPRALEAEAARALVQLRLDLVDLFFLMFRLVWVLLVG